MTRRVREPILVQPEGSYAWHLGTIQIGHCVLPWGLSCAPRVCHTQVLNASLILNRARPLTDGVCHIVQVSEFFLREGWLPGSWCLFIMGKVQTSYSHETEA